MKEAEDIIRDTREMIDSTHRNVTGKPASDDAVMLSLATQVYLLRKKVALMERANAELVGDHAAMALRLAEAQAKSDQLDAVIAAAIPPAPATGFTDFT
jgi:hypothetical protein